MKHVLLISAGFFHPPLLARQSLQRLIGQQTHFSLHSIHSLEEIREEFLDYSAWILYYHQKRISPRALAYLKQYTFEGGGILAIHSTTASFKDTPEYFQVLGGRFVEHGKVTPFEVIPNPEGELFATFDHFVLRDEIYHHQLEAGVQVHLLTYLGKKPIPVVWSHFYGKGRVLYAMPGHCSSSLRNPTYRKLLLAALTWVSSEREG
ncbi:MAG: ThuA domain-containing protein [Anaerolineales bacterium]